MTTTRPPKRRPRPPFKPPRHREPLPHDTRLRRRWKPSSISSSETASPISRSGTSTSNTKITISAPKKKSALSPFSETASEAIAVSTPSCPPTTRTLCGSPSTIPTKTGSIKCSKKKATMPRSSPSPSASGWTATSTPSSSAEAGSPTPSSSTTSSYPDCRSPSPTETSTTPRASPPSRPTPPSTACPSSKRNRPLSPSTLWKETRVHVTSTKNPFSCGRRRCSSTAPTSPSPTPSCVVTPPSSSSPPRMTRPRPASTPGANSKTLSPP
uniref:Uncharacterized protein n=1 Tax=Avian adenovirus 8 (strain ATCC A-2A) TaxID=66295 RepID=Q30BN4_ADEG8|nr:unknown [Fowl aviadenovirus 8]